MAINRVFGGMSNRGVASGAKRLPKKTSENVMRFERAA
jgi:hypothetical protein